MRIFGVRHRMAGSFERNPNGATDTGLIVDDEDV